jgi:hypothetical protein
VPQQALALRQAAKQKQPPEQLYLLTLILAPLLSRILAAM